MRIGLDVRALQTQGGSATRGIGRYVTDLVEGLLTFAQDDRIVLYAVDGRALPNNWATRCEVVPVRGLIYHELAKPWYMKIPKVRSNQALLRRLHDRATASQRAGLEAAVNAAGIDVLHLPTAVDVGSYPEGSFNVPQVMTFLDAIPVVHSEQYYATWGRFLQRFYDRQLTNLQNAARVVAISEASRSDAIKYAHLPPERVNVVYPSIAPIFFEAVDAREVRDRFELPGPFVLFCSVPDHHKNPLRVVEAFARFRGEFPQGTRLVFVSPLESPYVERIGEAARKFGLPDKDFVMTGRVSDEDLSALYRAASCLVSPSLIEGFGLPAAQALAAGTPPIVSCRGSQPEVVGDAGIIVEPESVEAIGAAMVRLLTDAGFRSELAERGRKRAQLFLPERQARELRAIYAEVSG